MSVLKNTVAIVLLTQGLFAITAFAVWENVWAVFGFWNVLRAQMVALLFSVPVACLLFKWPE